MPDEEKEEKEEKEPEKPFGPDVSVPDDIEEAIVWAQVRRRLLTIPTDWPGSSGKRRFSPASTIRTSPRYTD